MPLMDWSDGLSVGVQMVDTDHKRLVQLVNQLYDAVTAGHGKDALGKVLDGLIDYTKTHFAREEAEMARTHYPDGPAHVRQHRDFAKKVLDVQAQFKAGNQAVLSLQVMSFLRDWLLQHIQGTDRQMGAWLQQHPMAKAV